MRKVVAAAEAYYSDHGTKPFIISGYRSPAEQAELKRKGRPTADPDKSTHLSCPATGVDISLGWPTHDAHKLRWVSVARLHGLRAGGGSRTRKVRIGELTFDLPTDWNHVDVGPRKPGT